MSTCVVHECHSWAYLVKFTGLAQCNLRTMQNSIVLNTLMCQYLALFGNTMNSQTLRSGSIRYFLEDTNIFF